MTDYAKRMADLGISRGCLATGFKPEPPHDSPYLPGHDGSKAMAKYQPKMDDLSHLNSPHAKRLQNNVKNHWAKMTPEQRAEARRIRSLNANAVKGKMAAGPATR